MQSRLAYGVRRLRYYVWRTVGIGLTLTKYAVILAVIAFAVIGALSIVQPGLLTPLSDAGLPVPDGGESSPTGVEQSPASDAGVGAGTSTVTATQTDERATAASSDSQRERIENQIHQKINERRDANGLDPIPKDDLLRQIARSHSEEMAQQGYFAHESPSGETFEDRYDQFGYNCRVPIGSGRYVTGGENLWRMTASTEPSAETIASNAVRGWMESPAHRRNILRPYWDDMGIGVYVLDTGGGVEIYATQNFC
ncbi:CAP domain-containing protein [Haloplanus aerogenes]|uniref:CAP domain-containing protein n=1 Tax=Haloplanus aerogenes TaxID=660522 RepID=UPI001409C408|nr:CAP domain-containing protein [Haloplanus aerogenes]